MCFELPLMSTYFKPKDVQQIWNENATKCPRKKSQDVKVH